MSEKDFSAPSYSCMVQFVLLHCTDVCNRHFVSLEMQRAWSALQTACLNQDESLCHTVKSRNRGEPCTYGRQNDYYSIKTKTIKKIWCFTFDVIGWCWYFPIAQYQQLPNISVVSSGVPRNSSQSHPELVINCLINCWKTVSISPCKRFIHCQKTGLNLNL